MLSYETNDEKVNEIKTKTRKWRKNETSHISKRFFLCNQKHLNYSLINTYHFTEMDTIDMSVASYGGLVM